MVPLYHEFLSGEKRTCGEMKSSKFLHKEISGILNHCGFVFQLQFFSLFLHLTKSELFSVGIKTTQPLTPRLLAAS